MSVLKYVFILLEVLLLFNLLIFVHELGHFLAARWRGLKIDRFAIWFGKPIWKKKINGVEYALGTIPAGGYVALPQMATMEVIEGKGDGSDQPLPPISALDKIIVAFAGPLFSFLLAFAFAVVVWGAGRPASDGNSIVGWVDPSGPAWQAGLRPGDQILKVDGHPVNTFDPPSQDSVKWRIITSQGTNIDITFLRDGKEQTVQVAYKKQPTKWYERKALRQILVAGSHKAIIGDIATNSPAALAGLHKGDEIVAVDHQPIYSPVALIELEESMTNGPLRPVTLSVRRDIVKAPSAEELKQGVKPEVVGCDQFDRTLTAEKPLKPSKSGPSFGITAYEINTNVKIEHPKPVAQIREGLGQIAATLGAVFSHKGDIGLQQLGGPVMIIRLYTNLFGDTENGWRRVLWWSVVLNVNLALLNLLPFPVLDGGHILLALIEVIRRRPVSARVLQYIQTACAMLLIGFMLFIAFFDAGDWMRSRQGREEPLIFAPHK